MFLKLRRVLAIGMPDADRIDGFIDGAYIEIVGLLILSVEVF